MPMPAVSELELAISLYLGKGEKRWTTWEREWRCVRQALLAWESLGCGDAWRTQLATCTVKMGCQVVFALFVGTIMPDLFRWPTSWLPMWFLQSLVCSPHISVAVFGWHPPCDYNSRWPAQLSRVHMPNYWWHTCSQWSHSVFILFFSGDVYSHIDR